MTDEIKETVSKYMKTLTMAQSSREEVENVICGYMLDLEARELEIKTLKSHFVKLRSEAQKIINAQTVLEGCNHRFTRQVYDHCERVLAD